MFESLRNSQEQINDRVRTGDPEALNLFRSYVVEVQKIEPFSSRKIWDREWRQAVYRFGELFSEKEGCDPAPFLAILEEKSWSDNEPLAFLHSEIIHNLFSETPFIKEEFFPLIKKFSANPEFHHSYGHYLGWRKEYEHAITSYKRAILLEKESDTFVGSLFVCFGNFFSESIMAEKLDKAEEILGNLDKFFKDNKLNQKYWVFSNLIISMGERLEDHRIFEKKTKNMLSLLERKAEEVQSHLTNVVALLATLMGYISVGISEVQGDRPVSESLLIMCGFALTLILFAVSISYLFSGKKAKKESFWAFFRHPRFWVILILLALLAWMLHFSILKVGEN